MTGIQVQEQKPLQYCKVISLQLIKINGKKKKKKSIWEEWETPLTEWGRDGEGSQPCGRWHQASFHLGQLEPNPIGDAWGNQGEHTPQLPSPGE